MAETYALLSEYRTESGDTTSSDSRAQAMLDQQSAKLRAEAGISESRDLTDDQRTLCHMLVVDACRKALVVPDVTGIGPMVGLTQATFSANGFSGSYQAANGSGVAYWDRDTLKALKRSLGTSQSVGTVMPSCGRWQA